MKYYNLTNTDIKVSAIAGGCMWLPKVSGKENQELVEAAVTAGVNFFDHADIYFGGESERAFGNVLKNNKGLREKIYIQSKCGIQRKFYDFSKEHILRSVEGSLDRLGVDYLDVLLLHRPDTLMEPEEVAEAFDELHSSGKIRFFGVSNDTPNHMELLQKYVSQKLIFNQMQFGLGHTCMIDQALGTNTYTSQSIDRDNGILDYCRLKDITIQAWSPLQRGMFEGTFINDYDNYESLNKLLDELSEKYNVSKAGIATAWILRHPAKIQVVLGTVQAKHFMESVEGVQVELSRKEWYELYMAAGNELL